MQWFVSGKMIFDVAETEPAVNLRCGKASAFSCVPHPLNFVAATHVFYADDEMQRMSERLNALLAMPREPEVTVTYFRRDERKFGGAYVSHISRLKGVDEAYGRLELSDGLRIDLRDIVALGSPDLPEC